MAWRIWPRKRRLPELRQQLADKSDQAESRLQAQKYARMRGHLSPRSFDSELSPPEIVRGTSGAEPYQGIARDEDHDCLAKTNDD